MHFSRRTTTQGFSLLQLLVCCAVLGGLSQWILPSMVTFRAEQENQQTRFALQQHVKWAQTQALMWQRAIALCPVKNNTCFPDWKQEIVIFIDSNESHQFEPSSDVILKRFHLPQSAIKITWNQTLPLTFTEHAFQRNGSWVFRPQTGDPYQLTLSSTGRLHKVN